MDQVDTLHVARYWSFMLYHLESPEVKVTDLEILCYKSISNMSRDVRKPVFGVSDQV